MKTALIAGIAALFLATGTAHAGDTVPDRIIREWECDVKVSVTKDDGAIVSKGLNFARAGEELKGTGDILSAGNKYCDLKSTLIYGKKLILYFEPGGYLSVHAKRWKDIAASPEEVEIRGWCSRGG